MSGTKRKGPLSPLTSALQALMGRLRSFAFDRGEQRRFIAEAAESPRDPPSDALEEEDTAVPEPGHGFDGFDGFDGLSDIPIPEEAEGLHALGTSTPDRFGYLCTFSLPRNAEEAGDYYRQAFQQRSMAFAEYTDGSTVNLMGGNDLCSLLVGIFPRDNLEDGVTVTLTYGIKKAGIPLAER
ncbi:hypothetical protein [Cohnella sp.]|uniref:hypothetical protein n=1 Tax=Cohnella sp. TaxID=1883426 RepID=UPI003564A0A0